MERGEGGLAMLALFYSSTGQRWDEEVGEVDREPPAQTVQTIRQIKPSEKYSPNKAE